MCKICIKLGKHGERGQGQENEMQWNVEFSLIRKIFHKIRVGKNL